MANGQILAPILARPLNAPADLRGDKITVFKMKRRKGYRRKTGHRQAYTEVHIDAIEG